MSARAWVAAAIFVLAGATLGAGCGSDCGAWFCEPLTGGTQECEAFEALYEACTGVTVDRYCDTYDVSAQAGGYDCSGYFQTAIETFACDAATADWDWGTCD